MNLFNFDMENIKPGTLVWLIAAALVLSIAMNVMGITGIIPPMSGQTIEKIDTSKFVTKEELLLIMKNQMADTIAQIRGEFATKETMDLKFHNVNDKLDTIIKRLPP